MSTPAISKTRQLRNMLQSNQLEFIMEAHNGISARIVEEAGFKGIWGSGLALSAQFGVRDNNEASWTQVVEMLEFMSDVTDIPILLDGDTGYGNFNNMRRLVRKLEQRDIAGVCIEDKLFPKTNSFISGERQPLADMDEFSGKIKAGKDSQLDDDFNIVARIEALIAGWDVREALRRAEAYHEAGADAILIHSKMSKPDEILEFCQEWANRAPVVIVPTKYYSTPTDVFRKADISLVIWANHMIRTAVAAMQATANEVFENQTLVVVEDKIASVNELFRLQGADELVQAEKRYFNPDRDRTKAIILAASRGRALESLTRDKPKVMLPINGKPLLRHMADEFKKQGINDITVVAGYKADAIDVQGVKKVLNPDHETTGELQSLICAQDNFTDDILLTYGDLLFRTYILQDLLDVPGDLVMVVDSANSDTRFTGSPDYTWCSEEDDRSLLGADVDLKAIADCYDDQGPPPSGRWIGMLHIRARGMEWIKQALEELQQHEDYRQIGIPHLLEHLVKQGKPVKVHYIHGHWMDVNALEDLDRAGDFTK